MRDPFGATSLIETAILRAKEALESAAVRCLGRQVLAELVTEGIYFIIRGGLPYVGKSVNIARRLKEHARIYGEVKELLRIAVPKSLQSSFEEYFLRVVEAELSGDIGVGNKVRPVAPAKFKAPC